MIKRLLHQAHNIRQIARHPLNKGRARSALTRWLRWHISSRLALGPTVAPFVNDSVLVVHHGMHSATGNIFWGLSEPEEMGFCLHFLQPGDLFLDVGANVGVFSVIAKTAGADIIAIEPGPAAFAALTRNLAVNSFSADIRNVAVSDHDGSARFAYAGAAATNHFLADGEQGPEIEVPVTTIDAIVADRKVTAMKIDIEGHELPALHGATGLFEGDSLKVIITEVNNLSERYGGSDSDLLQFIASFGFRPYCYDPYARRLTAGTSGSDNMIFIRDIKDVQRRLDTAPRFDLSGGLSGI